MRVFGRAGGDVGEGVEDGVGVGAELLAGAGDGGVIGSQWSVGRTRGSGKGRCAGDGR